MLPAACSSRSFIKLPLQGEISWSCSGMLSGFLPMLATSRSQTAKEIQGGTNFLISRRRGKGRVVGLCFSIYLESVPNYLCSWMRLPFIRPLPLAEGRGKSVSCFQWNQRITRAPKLTWPFIAIDSVKL